MGLSRNKVAVPEGAAGTPPLWSVGSHWGLEFDFRVLTRRIMKARTDKGSYELPFGFLYYANSV